MKSKMRTGIIAMTLFAALAVPLQLVAQEQNEKERAKPHPYTFVEVPTFGGPNFFANFTRAPNGLLNNRGTLVGGADTLEADPFCFDSPDCFPVRKHDAAGTQGHNHIFAPKYVQPANSSRNIRLSTEIPSFMLVYDDYPKTLVNAFWQRPGRRGIQKKRLSQFMTDSSQGFYRAVSNFQLGNHYGCLLNRGSSLGNHRRVHSFIRGFRDRDQVLASHAIHKNESDTA